MWLRKISTPRRRREYAESKQRLTDKWPDDRAQDFQTTKANNDRLLAWATVKFGPPRRFRPLKLAGARFLHKALDYVPRNQLEVLYHGGLLDGERGEIMEVPWWRWPLALLAALYVPLALFGAIVFSILIGATSLHITVKVVMITATIVAFLGQAIHAALILIRSLQIARKLRRRKLVEQLRKPV